MILALILLAQGIAGYGSIQLPPPPQQITAGHRDFVSVKDFGAKSDGVTDDATAIQAAITAAQSTGARLYFPVGTYVVSTLAATSSVQIYGEGTLKQKATTTGDMLTISGTSTVVRIDGLTLDGNEQNQAFESTNKTVRFTAVGTATVPAGLSVTGCTFLNGSYSDISIHTDGVVSTSEWVRIEDSAFLGGREGTSQTYDPRYIDVSSPINYAVVGNVFDRLAAPVTFGRAGLVAYDGFVSGIEGTGTVTGNKFNFVGRSQVFSTLGSVDLYTRSHAVSIVGNAMSNQIGRGINVKSESKAVAIVGNTIDGLAGGSDGTIASQIVLNVSVVTAANGPFLISSNALYNSGQDAISVSAQDSGGTLYPHAVLVTGNTIKDPVRRGIGVGVASEVSLVGNSIYGGQIGAFIDAVTTVIHMIGNQISATSGNAVNISSTNTTAVLDVTANTTTGGTRGIFIASGAGGAVVGNVIKTPSISAVDVSGTTAGIRVTDNFSDAATPFVNSGTNTALHLFGNEWTMSPTTHTLTIAAGVVTATMDWHYIDGTAPDTLTTINGGYDGQILTLRPLTAAHVITVQDGTNLRLAGDFVMDDPQDSITLRWANDAWLEMSRSNNAANGFSSPIIFKPPVLFTGRVADLAAQSMFISAPAGEYRVCVTARTTTAGTGTTATLNILWTDDGGAKTDAVGTWALNSLTVTGQINKCEFIHVAAATNIQYSVTAGTYGTSVYAISGIAERLN